MLATIGGNTAFAQAPNSPESFGARTAATEVSVEPPAYINGIKVPYEITLAIQYHYPAHAIIDAHKITNAHKSVYRLRISRGVKKVNDTHLYFSKKWKFIKKETVKTAPKPISASVQSNAEQTPSPEPVTTINTPRESAPSGDDAPEPREQREPELHTEPESSPPELAEPETVPENQSRR